MTETQTAAPVRPRRRDAQQNREALLAAAASALASDPTASIDAIAAAAGLTRRALYGHFASREELIGELARQGTARIAGALSGVHDDDPATHVARIGAAVWQEIAHVRLVAQMIVRGPLERMIASGLDPVRRALRDAVARGADSGVFRDDVEPELVARLVEEAAIAVLEETVRRDLAGSVGRRLVMTTALGVAGLSWHEAGAVADRIDAEAASGGRDA